MADQTPPPCPVPENMPTFDPQTSPVDTFAQMNHSGSAIEQFNNSRLPDGNITSCYPLKATFVHPTYSLIWIDTLHDLMMLEGDTTLLESYTGEIQEVFDYYELLINAHGLVGKSEYNMFIDWYLPKGGNSVVNQDGNSAILTLNYAYTLGNAAEIMKWLGYRERAAYYRAQAQKYAETVRRLCFGEEKGIYADDPAHTFYDQRASILAVLTDAHTPEEKRALMRRVLSEDTNFDSRTNLFFYFYSFSEGRSAQGQVILPEGMRGEFVWNGQKRILKSGTN